MQTLDITPSPRILRTLGEIPFEAWQCIAELIDNSIDAFNSNRKADDTEKRVVVKWSKDSVAENKRTLEVRDNACGMTITQLQNAVRAGYSSNDPINNLGLFGMGFNIATARLGDYTEILTTRAGDDKWMGVRIDFDALTKLKRFDVPVIAQEKDDVQEHGTIIRISRLKKGIRDTLSNKANEIRRILQTVYSPLLRQSEIDILVGGIKLIPKEPCVWSAERYVVYNNNPVPAYREIDYSFGSSYFDVEKNKYLSDDEIDELNELIEQGAPKPDNIVVRDKRVTGWVGIQRFANPNNFGIDLVRNGRKIRVQEKCFFYYDNPWENTRELQYPVELGSTVGGRIIGELNVDFLLPTYQKNDFDRTDRSWKMLVEFLCGTGPFLPRARQALGFNEPVEAPIALLANAYRRCDAGTKCLFIPANISKQFLSEFERGNEKYIKDDLWFQAAREADQKRNTGGASIAVDTGNKPTDDVDSYFDDDDDDKKTSTTGTLPTGKGAGATGSTQGVQPKKQTSSLEDLLKHSVEVASLSGSYTYGQVAPFNVVVYELKQGDILVDSESKPCFFENKAINCTYIYNPRHVVFTQYPILPKTLLLQYLSERIKVRDSGNHSDIVEVYVNLMQSAMSEARIDRVALQERAESVFSEIKNKVMDALSGKKKEVIDCIYESSGEVEEILNSIFDNPDLMDSFTQREEEGYEALAYAPTRTLLRLVDRYPTDLFDGKVFKNRYSLLVLPDQKAADRVREETKDRILSYLKDALRVQNASNISKNELTRSAISIQSLEDSLS